jgi:hypothetical protein
MRAHDAPLKNFSSSSALVIAISTYVIVRNSVQRQDFARGKYRLVHLLLVAQAVLGIVLDGCAEEGVDEGCFPQTTLTNDHNRESSTSKRQALAYAQRSSSRALLYAPLRNDLVSLVGQVGNANEFIDVSGHRIRWW